MQRTALTTGSLRVLGMLVGLCALVVTSDAMAAGGMDFLSDLPAASFTQEDRDLMKKSVNEMLDSDDHAATRDWSNPKTGNSGTLKMVGQFTATDGAPCKRLWVSSLVKAGSVKNAATHTFCKYEGRGWLLHPEAVPAPASPK